MIQVKLPFTPLFFFGCVTSSGEMMPSSLRSAVDRIAALAVRMTRSRSAFLIHIEHSKVTIVGQTGGDTFGTLDNWPPTKRRDNPVQHHRRIHKEAQFHPFDYLDPFATHAFVVRAMGAVAGQRLELVAIDPRVPISTKLGSDLYDLACVGLDIASSLELATTVSQGFLETAPGYNTHPLSDFLLSTLVIERKHSTRHSVNFITLRRWRQPIKDAQLAALKAVKKDPPEELLKAIGLEIATAARSLYGQKGVDVVVPIACGHSQGHKCFSVEIANAVAKELYVPCIEAFERNRFVREFSSPT